MSSAEQLTVVGMDQSFGLRVAPSGGLIPKQQAAKG
jgi:hypothetical protein